MLFFVFDGHRCVMTDASSDILRKYWDIYCACRYDLDFSFPRYLQENGIYAKPASPNLSDFGYNFDDVDIYFN